MVIFLECLLKSNKKFCYFWARNCQKHTQPRPQLPPANDFHCITMQSNNNKREASEGDRQREKERERKASEKRSIGKQHFI